MANASNTLASVAPAYVILTRDANHGARSEYRPLDPDAAPLPYAEAVATVDALRATGGAWRYALRATLDSTEA